jgi:hypothetical protein
MRSKSTKSSDRHSSQFTWPEIKILRARSKAAWMIATEKLEKLTHR